MKIKLKDICHGRSGDKGDAANIGLIAYNKEDYELIRREVTAEKVKEFLPEFVKVKLSVTNYRTLTL